MIRLRVITSRFKKIFYRSRFRRICLNVNWSLNNIPSSVVHTNGKLGFFAVSSLAPSRVPLAHPGEPVSHLEIRRAHVRLILLLRVRTGGRRDRGRVDPVEGALSPEVLPVRPLLKFVLSTLKLYLIID